MKLERDTLAAMEAFLAAAGAGSFSGAAAKLGLTPSGVSKLVSRLEERLSVRLFQRTTRQMQLTRPGALYLERAQRIFDDLRELESTIQPGDDVPRGLLRVTAPAVLGQIRVVPAVVAFRKAFSEVKVDLLLADRLVDLVDEGMDVAIRMTASPPMSYAAKKLGDDERALCASPEYLAQRGRPSRPQDLASHDCLGFVAGMGDEPPVAWKLRTPSGKPLTVRSSCGTLRTNNVHALHQAALAGLGIADLPRYLASDDLRTGRLVSVLDECLAVERAVYAVYPAGRAAPARTREFVKLLARQFEEAAPSVVPLVRSVGGRR